MFHLLFSVLEGSMGRVNKFYNLEQQISIITISNVETVFNLKRYTHTK